MNSTSHAPWALLGIVVQFLSSHNFKTVVVVFDKQTSQWADLLLSDPNFINNLQHDVITVNVDKIKYSFRNQIFDKNHINAEYSLNIFFHDVSSENTLGWTIMRLNSADVRIFNLILSDQLLNPRLILFRIISLYQRRYLLNLAVLHSSDEFAQFYTVNPFETDRLIVIATNETDAFKKVFFEKSKNMNGHPVISCESVGSKQLMRLRSVDQRDVANLRNEQYLELIANYFNVTMVSNRMQNGSESLFENEICAEMAYLNDISK